MTWVKIKGSRTYEINKEGQIRRIATKEIVQPVLTNSGYLRVSKHRIHRTLAETFIPNLENKPEVNHIDGNRLNNSLDNLEWVTSSENTEHMLKTGRGNIKIKRSDIPKIVEQYNNRVSRQELAKQYGVTPKAITNVLKGEVASHIERPNLKRSTKYKLTLVEEQKIKQEYLEGNITQEQLAKKYKVGRTTIGRILYDKNRRRSNESNQTKCSRTM